MGIFLSTPFGFASGNSSDPKIIGIKNVISRVKECALLQCFPYRCVGICRL